MNVVIVVEIHRHWDFFKRFLGALQELNHEVTIVTPMLSVYLIAKFKYRLQSFWAHNISSDNGGGVYSDHDVLSGKLSKERSTRLFTNVFSALNRSHLKRLIDYIWVWNGSSSSGLSASDFAKQNGVFMRFFELSNVEGKLFVDGAGVNARSTLFSRPEKLRCIGSEVADFDCWKKKYLEKKLASHFVLQSSIPSKKYLMLIVDFFSSLLGVVILSDRVKVKRFFKVNKARFIKPGGVPDFSRDYIFFPMQVSTDTQLTLNSDYHNLTAIDFALKEAKSSNCDLYVKFHPAEENASFERRVYSKSKRYGFTIVDGNTFELVKKSKKVITINSSVGMEGLLLNKEVEFLGRSFYKIFSNKEYFSGYIMHYLLDVDPFSKDKIGTGIVNKVLSYKYD